jgi:hypothetical protein
MALQVGAYTMQQEDYGMYILYGLPLGENTTASILKEIDEEILKLQTDLISERNFQKLQNIFNSQFSFEEIKEKQDEIIGLFPPSNNWNFVNRLNLLVENAVIHGIGHSDKACEISITVNLSSDAEWPIFIQKPDCTEAAVELKPGDAMLYLGCVADHWREPYTGNNYAQVFMHYVRRDGPNAWAYFDKRK